MLASSKISLLLVMLVCSLGIRSDGFPKQPNRMARLPRFTLWAWERREDLHAIDAKRFAVAYLDQTITIGNGVNSQPRRDPVVYPASSARIAVVRIEATRLSVLDDKNRAQTLVALLSSAREQGISALQIDFDATRSQRIFYRSLLVDLRRQMPANLPLSITALASWCSWDSWLQDLPVDEAVPMFFRMEPDRRRAPPDIEDFQIREPLCRSSFGVSTTEPWPTNLAGKRLYIFPDHGWSNDPPTSLERRLP